MRTPATHGFFQAGRDHLGGVGGSRAAQAGFLAFLLAATTACSAGTTNPPATSPPTSSTGSSAAAGTANPSGLNGTILIGQTEALTGTSALSGQGSMNGALLAADQINAQGGVLGKRITIDAIDNACDPQTAVQAAQKAVADGVVGLAGDTCSGAEIPELRVFNPLHLPVVLVAATNPTVLGQGVGNIFRVVGNDNSQGSFAADFLVNYLNAKKIALIGDNTTYTVGLLAATQDELQKLGATVVFNDNINPADTDFTAEMQRAKATNPDAIYITPQAGPTGLVVRDARKVGYQGILMAAEVNALVLQEAGPGINDLYQDTYPDANQLPQAATFIQQYKAKFNADPVPESANGYVAVMVLVDAIRRANSTDAQKIVAALGTTDYNGITGNIKFTSTGENANPQFIALKAVNGAWVGYKRFDGTNWVDVVSTTP